MSAPQYIPLHVLCTRYELEITFFHGLDEVGLITIEVIAEIPHISEEALRDLEKMVRLHRELELNTAGIDVVWNLLQKIDSLQEELAAAKSRLGLYE